MAKVIPDDKFAHLAGPFINQALCSPKDLSTDTLQAFLCNLSFLCRSFSHEFFQGSLAGLLCQCLERPNLFLQNLSLEKLSEEYVYSSFSASTLADKIVPQLCKEACKNPEPNIKTQALYVISLVTWKLDESYVAQNILPSLKYIVDNERTPAVSMSVIGNFESIGNSLGLNYVASSILPVLQVMLLDEALDRDQFEMIVNIVKRLLKKILNHRTMQLKMPEIGVAEVVGKNAEDPFAPAKALIAQAKQRNSANNYGMVTGTYSLNANSSSTSTVVPGYSSGKTPPPAPSGPPPPPPPGHAPSEPPSEIANNAYNNMSVSGNPLFSANTTSDTDRRRSIGGLALASGIIPSMVGDSNTSVIAPYQSNFNSTATSGVLNFSAPIDLTATLASTTSGNISAPSTSAMDESTKPSSSLFGWFSSSSSSSSTSNTSKLGNTSSSMSGYGGISNETNGIYKPPIVPGAATASSNNQLDDVDDFLSSFGQQSNNTSSSSKNNTGIPSRYSDNYKPPTSATATSNSINTISNNTSTATLLPISTNTQQTLTIQQQIEQTQLEIARLSTTTTSVPINTINPVTAVNSSFSTPQNYSSNFSQQQQTQPQQQFYGSHNVASSGYAPPVVANMQTGTTSQVAGQYTPSISTSSKGNMYQPPPNVTATNLYPASSSSALVSGIGLTNSNHTGYGYPAATTATSYPSTISNTQYLPTNYPQLQQHQQPQQQQQYGASNYYVSPSTTTFGGINPNNPNPYYNNTTGNSTTGGTGSGYIPPNNPTANNTLNSIKPNATMSKDPFDFLNN